MRWFVSASQKISLLSALGLHSFFLANATKVKNTDFKENPKGRKQLKKGSERTEPQKSTNDVADGHENEAQSP